MGHPSWWHPSCSVQLHFEALRHQPAVLPAEPCLRGWEKISFIQSQTSLYKMNRHEGKDASAVKKHLLIGKHQNKLMFRDREFETQLFDHT